MDSQYEVLPISKAASSSNDKDTTAANILDGNNETRWSAKGKDEFLEIDLGKPMLASGIAIKWYEADIRRMLYTLYYSQDGGENGNWRRIGSALSSGNELNEYEEHVFDRPIEMQYIKIVGEGNSLNEFISIVDVKVLGGRKDQVIAPPAGEVTNRAAEASAPKTLVVDASKTNAERVDVKTKGGAK